jgi:hydrogenase expression/formation protein HypC
MMCLAVPMRLLQKTGVRGQVETGGVMCNVGLDFLPDADVGDYVLVHAGFAIQRIDEDEALKTLALFEEMERLD